MQEKKGQTKFHVKQENSFIKNSLDHDKKKPNYFCLLNIKIKNYLKFIFEPKKLIKKIMKFEAKRDAGRVKF